MLFIMYNENERSEANDGGLYEKRVGVLGQDKVEVSKVGKVNVDTVAHGGAGTKPAGMLQGESGTQSRITQRGKRHKFSIGRVEDEPTMYISAQEQARRSNQRNHQGYAQP